MFILCCSMTKSKNLLIYNSPDETLGLLFYDVQKMQIYGDSKVFSDLVPKYQPDKILREYLSIKSNKDFDLRKFIEDNFHTLDLLKLDIEVNPKITVREKILELWTKLERNSSKDEGSLISLPYPYIVPGGRFSEQYYWDSFFIMLGLVADEKWDVIEGMIKNIAYMIDKFGFIPTANRTYYLSRSQPPFFSHMIKLLALHKGPEVMSEYLPYLLLEYQFWMVGKDDLSEGRGVRAINHVVKMPDNTVLNRYYDSRSTPRPESFDNDTRISVNMDSIKASLFYQHLRAGAESGWDFSSRWFDDPQDIRTIRTADIVPVDLNCLLYQLEETISEAYNITGQPVLAQDFKNLSKSRKKSILKYCWDDNQSFFVDYDLKNKQMRSNITLASVFPLFANIATKHQAALIAKRLKRDFLKVGGFDTTLISTEQQWDSPNGWAPLQWVAIEGLRNYGYNNLAETARLRWVKANLKMFKYSGKLVEKYDVKNSRRLSGGGEYPLQDGFGWTNGVLVSLLDKTK